ncbi:hypothetical protein MCUN1_002809 [Malassezia cuniculi]|uniref:Uncharacterized protein n=1 Tax=Malassezia cuniculi TaxID=948313 RepID=A0AAF0J775_9BASI|nr:hypothetical protein MCUN1_002809 [Malassezia cuniculi]
MEPPDTEPLNHPECSVVHAELLEAQQDTCDQDELPVSLDEARIVAQVDCKYIVCAVNGATDTSLVCMDQHAVDERVRFEANVATYVTAARD